MGAGKGAGKGAGAPEQDLGFMGHLRDRATGLTYMQARLYSPVEARFLSVDPVGFAETGDLGMVNRYSYGFNDPVNMWDPDGRMPLTCPGCGLSRFLSKNINSVGQQTVGAQNDFRQSYREMKIDNTIGNDKFFHCRANCDATKRGEFGEVVAEVLSDAREVYGDMKGDSAEDIEADQSANLAGREGAKSNPEQTCSATCSDFLVPGMGQNGDFTEGEPVPSPNDEHDDR